MVTNTLLLSIRKINERRLRQEKHDRSTRHDSRQRLQTPRHFLSVFATVESRDAEEPFAARSETASGRDNDVQFLQHPIEHLPARQVGECLDPDVRSIHAAVNWQPGARGRFAQDARVSHVMIDQTSDLATPLGRIDCLRPALHRVTDAICLGAPAAMPQGMQWELAAIGGGRLRIRANCAARTLVSDIRPIAEIQQRTGVPIECGISESPM